MHSLFFQQVDSGVEGYREIPPVYTQSVEKPTRPVKKQVIIDLHTDEKDEKIIEFDLGKPEQKEEIIHFDLGISCEECE